MASQWWMLPRSYSGGCRCSGVDISPAWQPQGLWNIVHAEKIRRFEIGIFECFRLLVRQNMLTALRRLAAPTPSLMSRTLSRHSVRAIFNPRAEGSSCFLMSRGLRHCHLITTSDGPGLWLIIVKVFHTVRSRSSRGCTLRNPTTRLGERWRRRVSEERKPRVPGLPAGVYAAAAGLLSGIPISSCRELRSHSKFFFGNMLTSVTVVTDLIVTKPIQISLCRTFSRNVSCRQIRLWPDLR